MTLPYFKTLVGVLLLAGMNIQFHSPTSYYQHAFHQLNNTVKNAVLIAPPAMTCTAIPQLTDNGATLASAGVTGGIACTGCTVTDENNVVNSDLTDHATIVIPIGLAGSAHIAVQYGQTFPSGTRAGFVMDVNGGVAGVLNNVSLTSYLNNVEQETVNSTNLVNLVGLGGDANVSGVFCQPFDEVRLNAGALVGVIATYRVFYSSVNEGAYFPVQCGFDIERTEICNDCIDNDGDGLLEFEDTSCTSVSNACSTVPQTSSTGASLGDSGIDAPSLLGISLCVGCSVTNEGNLIDENFNNAATISFPVSVTGSGYVSVVFDQEFPAGTRGGFAVDVNGGIAGLLNGVTLTSYNNGVEQQALSDGSLLSLLGIGGNERVDAIFCQPFDELRFTVASTVGIGKSFDIFYALIDEGAQFPVQCGLATAATEVCGDCIDNDGDGLLDAEDTGCAAPSLAPPFLTETLENTTGVILDLNATDDIDSEGSGLTYAFTNDPTNSPDENLFTLNPTTGEVSFNTPPNHEDPLDSNGDNNYQFEISVTDSSNLTTTMTFVLTITDDCETSPVLLSYE